MAFDELGDRMKTYEGVETQQRFNSSLPLYARIDGRGFSRFTKGMERPFDQRMTDAMIEVAKYLVVQTHATIAFVQSDEISLAWHPCEGDSMRIFDDKKQKVVSILASMAAAKMAQEIVGWEPFCDRLPAFDARVMEMPSLSEATNMLLWRHQDARRNSVSMACRSLYSSREMNKKNQIDMLGMIKQKGVSFEDYPDAFRNGTFIRRQTVERCLSVEEWERIPERNRPDINAPVKRTVVVGERDVPFQRMTNRVGYSFFMEYPVVG